MAVDLTASTLQLLRGGNLVVSSVGRGQHPLPAGVIRSEFLSRFNLDKVIFIASVAQKYPAKFRELLWQLAGSPEIKEYFQALTVGAAAGLVCYTEKDLPANPEGFGVDLVSANLQELAERRGALGLKLDYFESDQSRRCEAYGYLVNDALGGVEVQVLVEVFMAEEEDGQALLALASFDEGLPSPDVIQQLSILFGSLPFIKYTCSVDPLEAEDTFLAGCCWLSSHSNKSCDLDGYKAAKAYDFLFNNPKRKLYGLENRVLNKLLPPGRKKALDDAETNLLELAGIFQEGRRYEALLPAICFALGLVRGQRYLAGTPSSLAGN